MEIWDLLDEHRRPLNRTHRRGDAQKPGEFHNVVEVWTVNSQGKVLITLRDPEKETYPNQWECTCGSLLTGESSKQGAIRELFEETGISANEAELEFLGTVQETSAFVDIYLLKRDVQLTELILQAGETVDAQWVDYATLNKMIEDSSIALPVGRRYSISIRILNSI